MLGNKKNVEYFFAGFLDNEELIEAYKEIKPWLFITTSATEGGAPVSMQEVLSLGVPCIGTNAGGIPEIIENGCNGFLLKTDPNTSEIRTAIENYYRFTKEQRAEYRKNAFKTWEQRFDAKSNAGQLLQELTVLLSK